MNKHLKPGVAVDVRGASDEDVQAVIDACLNAGASKGVDCYKAFVKWGIEGSVWLSRDHGAYEILTINQALGRESEVENTWFERGELPPVGTVCQIAASTEYLHISYPEGSEVKVYSNFTDDRGTELAAFVCPKGKIGGVAIAKCFRPLKTEKEKFVELLFNETGNITENEARALYDKGLRFTE